MDEQKSIGTSGTDYSGGVSSRRESHFKLFKSRSNKLVDGVCGGIGEYFGVDAVAVRLLLVAFTILSIEAGVIFYVVSMILIPMRPLSVDVADDDGTKVSSSPKFDNASSATATLIIGVIVVIIGVTLLFDYYDIFSVISTWHSAGKLALPIIFILIGGALLIGKDHRDVNESVDGQGQESRQGDSTSTIGKRKLFRSKYDKEISGVCGGFAEYFDVDATIVRLIFVLLTFASFGLALILYISCAFVIPGGVTIVEEREHIGSHSSETNP